MEEEVGGGGTGGWRGKVQERKITYGEIGEILKRYCLMVEERMEGRMKVGKGE